MFSRIKELWNKMSCPTWPAYILYYKRGEGKNEKEYFEVYWGMGPMCWVGRGEGHPETMEEAKRLLKK